MSVLSADYSTRLARRSMVQTVPPAGEPLSPADFKQHQKISASDEDTLIAAQLSAARRWAETFTRRQFVLATWKLYLDRFPCYALRLPRPPLISVSSIQYVDTAGATQTLDDSLYQVDHNHEPGLIVPDFGQVWPTTRDGTPNAVTVTYLAGYGAIDKTRLDLASVLAGTTVTVNGITFTAHATTTTASAREFAISGVDAADASELVGLLNNQTYGLPAAKVNVVASNLDAAGTATARITLTPTPGTTIVATASAATVTISTNYECTTADSIAAVPETIKAPIKLLTGHYYENREAFTEGALAEVPMAVKTLLWSERVLELD